MKVFVAGATGTLGRPTVQQLVAHGHDVLGLTRTQEGCTAIERSGARGVVGNALDAEAVRATVVSFKPDVVAHLLTALPPGGALRASQLVATNELRVKATATLLQASIEAGTRRLVAESFVGIYGPLAESRPLSEDDPLPPHGEGSLRDAVMALRSLEDQLEAASFRHEIETVALRIGFLYGHRVPSTHALLVQARTGRLVVPAGMRGVAPFVQIDDAVAAIVAAIEQPSPSGVYNIVDDEPMALTAFLEALSHAIGAPAPREVPRWLVRVVAPLVAELASATLVLSNAKVKSELGWAPRYPNARIGLAELAPNSQG